MAWDKNIFVGSSKCFSARSQVFMHCAKLSEKWLLCSLLSNTVENFGLHALKNSKKVVEQTIDMSLIYVLF